jgi:plastocyanin
VRRTRKYIVPAGTSAPAFPWNLSGLAGFKIIIQHSREQSMRIPRFIAILTVAAILGVGTSCEDEPTAPADDVNVLDDEFEPGTLSVDVGTTVTWSWLGINQHNVTWVVQGAPASPTQTSGTYARTFDAAGAFAYYCTIHGTPTSGMRGSVTVQ